MKYHFTAIGGSVMANLAVSLKKEGHQISGSDDVIFDPTYSLLKKENLLPENFGWFPEKISEELDAVFVGMHAKADNPELLRAKALGLKIFSFPEYVYYRSQNKERIVIAGSHGKTTVTSLLMHILKFHDYKFDYVIGAKVPGFESNVSLSDNANVILIEGDEYATSPLDPKPKFLHYHHHIAVLNGIAWDHANIYPDIDSYLNAFRSLVWNTPKAGTLLGNKDDKLVKLLIGESEKSREDVLHQYYEPHPARIRDGITFLKTEFGEYPVSIFGEHNLCNLNAAFAVCKRIGIRGKDFYEAVKSFKGAERRLEVRFENESTTVFYDFAHAPSKVEATVSAVKNQFPKRKLAACLELHTFSSMNKNFIPQYKNSLKKADFAAVFVNPELFEKKGLPAFGIEEIRTAFGRKDIVLLQNKNELEAFISAHKKPNTNVLLMSSGDFGGHINTN
jgi:UDP-N-acetylmuramate: L-alanyl-gamma-D-glutamyl-meso-diaminopimelate ligase